MANGYEKFFKDAQMATGLSKPGTAKPRSQQGKPRFPLKSETRSAGPAKSKRQGNPEERLRQELAERMKARKAQALRKRKKFPTHSVLCTVAALITAGVGYWKSDLIDDWLNRVEITAFGQANAAESAPPAPKTPPKTAPKAADSTAKSSAGPGAKEEKAAEAKAGETVTEAPPVKQWTQEELSFFSKLNERKKELDQRELDLGKLEEELQRRKAELDEKLKSLEAMRAEISKTLKTRVATDQEKVDKLVQFYSSMKPQQAAKVIESLNEDLAVEILDKMKKKSAAEILDTMDSAKARRLSELLTGYERSPSAVTDDDGKQDAAAETAAPKATKK